MKKRNLKKITAILAAMEILLGPSFTNHAKAMDIKYYYVINENGKLEKIDNFDVIRNHQKTIVEDGEDISIFNDKNGYSRQYGGDQNAFERSFKSLIADPIIWRMMQEYFPEEDFISHDVAMDFYREYFRELTLSGCGYVAVANKVFEAFKNKEEDFEKIFGYPMYIIKEGNVIDFNYEYFILDFANYSLASLGRITKVKTMFDKTLAGIDLRRYQYSDEYKERPKINHNLTMEEVELIRKVNDKYHELNDRYKKATDTEVDISLPLNPNLGNLKKFLDEHGIDASISLVTNINGGYKSGDIIASEKFSIQKEKDGEVYAQYDDVGAHYMYVVEATGEKIIVSSWGEKYIFDDNNAEWIDRFDIKIKYKSLRGQ